MHSKYHFYFLKFTGLGCYSSNLKKEGKTNGILANEI